MHGMFNEAVYCVRDSGSGEGVRRGNCANSVRDMCDLFEQLKNTLL